MFCLLAFVSKFYALYCYTKVVRPAVFGPFSRRHFNRLTARFFFLKVPSESGNTLFDGNETRHERCPCSHLEVREIMRRYRQPLLNGEENAECTEATDGRCLGELPRGV